MLNAIKVVAFSLGLCLSLSSCDWLFRRGGVEICGNGRDDNGNGDIDCGDLRCNCLEVCDNGVDDDADGFVDCDDNSCQAECVEVCDDGRDNDQDGDVDCEDNDCFDPICDELCDDDEDNDADGLTDCEDDDCECVEVCDDGVDNDANGLVDCEDPSCADTCVEDCSDGRDNDGDGAIDCQDADCMGPDCVGTTRARITGGTGQLIRQSWGVTVVAPSTSPSAMDSVGCGEVPGNSHALFRDTVTGALSGEVQAATVSGAVETCTWRAQIDFAGRHNLFEPVQFNSVQVNSAARCSIVGTSFLPRRLLAYSSDRINLAGTPNNWMAFVYDDAPDVTAGTNSTRTQTFINGCQLDVDAEPGRQRVWPVTFQPTASGTYTRIP